MVAAFNIKGCVHVYLDFNKQIQHIIKKVLKPQEYLFIFIVLPLTFRIGKTMSRIESYTWIN